MQKISISLKDARKKAEDLRREIRDHDRRYFMENAPIISDFKYDLLVRQLKQIEETFPTLITPDSPTHRIGEAPIEGFKTIRHSIPMLSIENAYSHEEVLEFRNRIQKTFPKEKIQYVVEPKIDGLAVLLRYEKGLIVTGATRGDGFTGDDVTSNLKTIRSIPLRLENNHIPSMLEVKGEVYMDRGGFEKFNQERQKKGEPSFANPRNAASGSLKLLDPHMTAQRPLKFFAHGVGAVEGLELNTHFETLQTLQSFGIRVVEHYQRFDTIEKVLDYCDQWEEKKKKLPYDIDGIAIKVDSKKIQNRLGTTSKSPRWVVAYKYHTQGAVTVLKDILIQVGRTGTLTPVAILEPVGLGGTTISRATLHNEDEIKRKDIRIGDHILIEKGGEVIPKVTGVISEKRPKEAKPFRFPSSCPVCGSKVVRDEEEVAIRCENLSCPAQVIRSLLHFASRNAMDIEGLGIALVEQLVDLKMVKNISDLYRLKLENLLNIERMGEKSSQNLLDGIEKSKMRSLHRLIFGLGIRHVGIHAAEILASKYKNMNTLIKASYEDLQGTHGIGPIMAKSIDSFFQVKENLRTIKDLREFGLNMTDTELSSRKKDVLGGKVFVLTGTLESLSRDDAEDLIKKLGGRVSSSVSKKTDYVVAGLDPGSKFEKAKSLGIKILNEDELLGLLKQKG